MHFNKVTGILVIASLLTGTIVSSTGQAYATTVPKKAVSSTQTTQVIDPKLLAVYPHAVTADGKLVIEGKITNTDYSSILLALLEEMNENGAKAETRLRFEQTFNSAMKYFIVPNEKEYESKAGQLIAKKSEIDPNGLSQWVMLFTEVMKKKALFNASPAFQKTLVATAEEKITAYSEIVMKSYSKNGLFYDGKDLSKTSMKGNNFGVITLGLAMPYLKGSVKEAAAKQLALSAELYVKAYKAEYKTIDFAGEGKEVKFLLKDAGQFLWASSLLSNAALLENNTDTSFLLMKQANAFLKNTFVEGKTVNAYGPTGEFIVKLGQAESARPDVAGGNYQGFVYAFKRFAFNPFHLYTGQQKEFLSQYSQYVTHSVVNHRDAYGIVHDVQWSNPKEMDSSKETPYFAWFIVNAYESSKLSAVPDKTLRSALDQSKAFLFEKILKTVKP